MLPPPGILTPWAVPENNEWFSELCLVRAELSVSLGWFQGERLGRAPFSLWFHWFGSREGVWAVGQLWRKSRDTLLRGRGFWGEPGGNWVLEQHLRLKVWD